MDNHTHTAREFLKRYSTVSNAFIDDFFAVYNETSAPGDFVVELSAVAKWLRTTKGNLKQTLSRSYTKDLDYTISKPPKGTLGRGKAKTERIMMTADCFKALCMMSRTPKAAEVRAYFITVEGTLFKYRAEITAAMQSRIGVLERNQRAARAKPERGGVIYVIRASESMSSVVKIGKTVDLAGRLRSHGSAHADALDVLYVYQTKCTDKVEACMKLMLRENQYRKYKEVYQVDLDSLKKVISACDDACMAPTYRKRGPSQQTGGYFAVVLKD